MYPGDIERLTMVHQIQRGPRERTLEIHRLLEDAHAEQKRTRLQTVRATVRGFLSGLLPSQPVGESKTMLNKRSEAGWSGRI